MTAVITGTKNSNNESKDDTEPSDTSSTKRQKLLAKEELGNDVDTDRNEINKLLEMGKLLPPSPSVNSMPSSIISYESITKLDLFQCNLSSLPQSLPKILPNLSILFCMKNKFTQVPNVIGTCPKLQMVSFKSNQISSIHPDALASPMRWLILTDNLLESIPSTIGRCTQLQKLMLSGNRLRDIPDEISMCTNLELVRLAANQLQHPPMKLLQLPNLAWIAFSGNPFLLSDRDNTESTLSQTKNDRSTETLSMTKSSSANKLLVIDDDNLDDPNNGELLGKGASGVTRKFIITNPNKFISSSSSPSYSQSLLKEHHTHVAVKEYASEMTSDGSPEEERRVSMEASLLHCDALVPIIGQTKKGSLVMQLLSNYHALANPPSMKSCSRDVYDHNAVHKLHIPLAKHILLNLVNVLTKLHGIGICHGDFYGHNILVHYGTSQEEDDFDDVKLTDFGAAFFYPKDSDYGSFIEQIEIRAFGHLVEEISALLKKKSCELGSQNQYSTVLTTFANRLMNLVNMCLAHNFHDNPITFSNVSTSLKSIIDITN